MKTIGLIDEKSIKHNLINLKNIVFEVTEKCNLMIPEGSGFIDSSKPKVRIQDA
jgi:hypothetical protein